MDLSMMAIKKTVVAILIAMLCILLINAIPVALASIIEQPGVSQLAKDSQVKIDGPVSKFDPDTLDRAAWVGNQYFLDITGEGHNELHAILEFYYFASSPQEAADFYVIHILSKTTPRPDDTGWLLPPGGVGDGAGPANMVNASVTNGAIRWDYNVPWAYLHYEEDKVIQVTEKYSISASLEGGAFFTADGKGPGVKGAIDSSYEITNQYTITLYKWEIQPSGGSTGFMWKLGLTKNDDTAMRQEAIGDYLLVLTADHGTNVDLSSIQMMANTWHRTYFNIKDMEEHIWAKIANIHLNYYGFAATNTPSTPSGPSSGYRGTYYSYSTSTTDPEGNDVRYQFDWGDGQTTTTGWYQSGSAATASHAWGSIGTYYVKARAQDDSDRWSDWSSSRTVNIVNRAPYTPSTPSGPSSGNHGTSYSYSTSTTDPDGDSIYYKFDWGDGTTSVVGPYTSGSPASTSHIWSSAGTYNVKACAKDQYCDWGSWSSTLTVSMANRAPNTPPQAPSGPSSGYVSYTYTYSAATTDPDGDNLSYQFDWGDSTTTTTGWYGSGSTASASHSWSSTGTYYVKVRAQDTYNAWSGWSASLSVSITTAPPPPPGGGGCPYVYTWDGNSYVKDNNLLPASETSNGTDTKDYYRLEQYLAAILQGTQSSIYSLQIREFENETDYIDQVKLIVVDHPQGTNIAVTPEGEILTYTNPTSPRSCIDNHGINRLNEIGTMNGNINDLSTYFQGYKGDWLVLNFGKVKGPYAKLILRDDQKCCDVCINVQILDSSGNWQTVEVLHPRDYWGIEAVNLAAYVQGKSDFKVRLQWTATHRLDYVGLDTSPPVQTKISTVSPILATHSTQGDVRAKLLSDDEQCVKLVSGQQITLTFLVPNTTQAANRDFIFYTNGYYYTTTN